MLVCLCPPWTWLTMKFRLGCPASVHVSPWLRPVASLRPSVMRLILVKATLVLCRY